MGRRIAAVTALAAVAALAAGCGSNSGGDGNPSGTKTATASPSIAEDVPKGFDPCTDIPAGIMAAERQKSTGRSDADAPNGVKWRGCRWVMNTGSGYGASIRTSNITLDMVRARNFRDTRQVLIGSRQALSTRQSDDDAACVVNVEMKGGSLEFLVNNPKSNKDTGHIDSCQLARDLAEKVVPAIPAGA
ncbi:DUF3558 domain-containing protein [Nocardia goodfellowii]